MMEAAGWVAVRKSDGESYLDTRTFRLMRNDCEQAAAEWEARFPTLAPAHRRIGIVSARLVTEDKIR